LQRKQRLLLHWSSADVPSLPRRLRNLGATALAASTALEPASLVIASLAPVLAGDSAVAASHAQLSVVRDSAADLGVLGSRDQLLAAVLRDQLLAALASLNGGSALAA
jgi:hypothetical protein